MHFSRGRLTFCWGLLWGVAGWFATASSAWAVVPCGSQDRAVLERKQVSAQTIAHLCGDEIGPIAPEGVAPQILIVPLTDTTTSASKLEFTFRITAFAPVKEVRINGGSQRIKTPALELDLPVTLELDPGENEILVTAKTQEQEHSRTVLVFRETDEVKRYRGHPVEYHAEVQVSVAYEDNVAEVADSQAKTGDWLSRFAWQVERTRKLNATDRWSVQAVGMRDWYQKPELRNRDSDNYLLGYEWKTSHPSRYGWSLGGTVSLLKNYFASSGEQIYALQAGWDQPLFDWLIETELEHQRWQGQANANLKGGVNAVRSRVGFAAFSSEFELAGRLAAVDLQDTQYDRSELEWGLATQRPDGEWVYSAKYQNSHRRYLNQTGYQNSGRVVDRVLLNVGVARRLASRWQVFGELQRIQRSAKTTTLNFAKHQLRVGVSWAL